MKKISLNFAHLNCYGYSVDFFGDPFLKWTHKKIVEGDEMFDNAFNLLL